MRPIIAHMHLSSWNIRSFEVSLGSGEETVGTIVDVILSYVTTVLQ
jgi:hypothetical protein